MLHIVALLCRTHVSISDDQPFLLDRSIFLLVSTVLTVETHIFSPIKAKSSVGSLPIELNLL